MIMLFTIAAQAAQQDPTASARLILAVLCVVVASSIALAVSIGFARRMHQIADQSPRKHRPPDEPDDA